MWLQYVSLAFSFLNHSNLLYSFIFNPAGTKRQNNVYLTPITSIFYNVRWTLFWRCVPAGKGFEHPCLSVPVEFKIHKVDSSDRWISLGNDFRTNRVSETGVLAGSQRLYITVIYNVIWTLRTLDGRWNGAVCQLGCLFKLFSKISCRALALRRNPLNCSLLPYMKFFLILHYTVSAD